MTFILAATNSTDDCRRNTEGPAADLHMFILRVPRCVRSVRIRHGRKQRQRWDRRTDGRTDRRAVTHGEFFYSRNWKANKQLFNTNIMDTVKFCQDQLGFELPSVLIVKRRDKFLARYKHNCFNLWFVVVIICMYTVSTKKLYPCIRCHNSGKQRRIF